MKIITLTLNPAYDIHYGFKTFEPYKENYVSTAVTDAGGKGVNVSRALLANGVKSTAYIILGRANSAEFVSAIDRAGLSYMIIAVDGRIRENITLHSENSPETRISFDSFAIDEDILSHLEKEVWDACDADTVVVFAGRVPKGVDLSQVIAFLKKLKAKGARLAVDSNSFSLDNLIDIGPWLIKPNEQEIQMFAEIKTVKDAEITAELLRKKGIENVIVSMGKDGAAFAGGGISCTASVPDVPVKSTIGAGDSTLAGFIAAYSQKKPLEVCLKTAVSFGTAACLTEGTLPPKAEDVAKVYEQIRLI